MIGIISVVLIVCFALSGLISMSLWVGIRLSYLEHLGLDVWRYFPRSHKDVVDTIRFGAREGKVCLVSGALALFSFLALFLLALLKQA